jgi:hypothetical protein
MTRPAQSLLLLSVLACGPVQALTVERLDTRLDHGVYRVSLQAILQASPASVAAVLKDYDDYPALDARIRSSQRLADEPGGIVLIRTLVHACAGFFCRNVVRVERVEQSTDGLVATIVPDRSQVRHGYTKTSWQANGAGTLVTYEAEFEPDFWVPELIGRTLAVDALRASTLALFNNVEKRARDR